MSELDELWKLVKKQDELLRETSDDGVYDFEPWFSQAEGLHQEFNKLLNEHPEMK
jgi:hypothetical protein